MPVTILCKEFFEDIDNKYKEDFINKYFLSDEENRESIDNFIRNYIRYSRNWGIKIENETYKKTMKSLGLKIQPGIISLYCFKSKTERENVLEFLKEIAIIRKKYTPVYK